MTKNISIIFSLLLLLLSGCESEKTAFVRTAYLYEEFKGKTELEANFEQLQSRQRFVLDSLLLLVRTFPEKDTANSRFRSLLLQYETVQDEFSSNEERIRVTYNEQIWNQINTYIEEYGRKEGYDYIFGADGTGNIMFADSTRDISEPVLIYLNERYEGN